MEIHFYFPWVTYAGAEWLDYDVDIYLTPNC